jgi:nitrite reductase/ring-hydroxylating ferredoxin subunit
MEGLARRPFCAPSLWSFRLIKDATMFELCRVDDVRADAPFLAEMNGEELAVYEVAGRYYVTQNACTHGPGSLADGYVDGEEIECPFHQGRFSILTGEATFPPCTEPLRVWDAVVRDGKIYVDSAQNPPVD